MREHTREEINGIVADLIEKHRLTPTGLLMIRDECIRIVANMRTATAEKDVKKAAEKGFNS